MPELTNVIAELPKMPIEQQLVIVALSALALAAFAIYVVFVTSRRSR